MGRRRDTSAMSVVQNNDKMPWTAHPARNPGRCRRPGIRVPAAARASRTSRPVTAAHAVEGSPLSVPAIIAAMTMSRAVTGSPTFGELDAIAAVFRYPLRRVQHRWRGDMTDVLRSTLGSENSQPCVVQ